jgi:hypothetical protein
MEVETPFLVTAVVALRLAPILWIGDGEQGVFRGVLVSPTWRQGEDRAILSRTRNHVPAGLQAAALGIADDPTDGELCPSNRHEPDLARLLYADQEADASQRAHEQERAEQYDQQPQAAAPPSYGHGIPPG